MTAEPDLRRLVLVLLPDGASEAALAARLERGDVPALADPGRALDRALGAGPSLAAAVARHRDADAARRAGAGGGGGGRGRAPGRQSGRGDLCGRGAHRGRVGRAARALGHAGRG